MSTLPVMAMAAAMMVVGAGFVYYLVRNSPEGRPRGALQWTATGLATLLVVTSGLLLFLAAIIYSGGGEVTGQSDRLARAGGGVGEAAPSLSFRTVDGGARRLDDYRGNVVLLNFWATWCGPCLHELPDLNDLQETYGEAGLVVLALSDESPETLADFLEEHPMQTVTGYLPSVSDVPQPFAGTLSIRPTTYVIDREGTVREFVKGARDYAFFEQSIKPYL